MFKKILVANRGEIAHRIISTCKDMGIETVAIYTNEDRSLSYLNTADYAYNVGDSDGYKNQDLIIKIAKENKVSAIHPGYGFLSEDYSFASKCEKEGIKFIGSNVLNLTIDKIKLKEIAKELRIKTLEYSLIKDKDIKSLKLGTPTVLKPVTGFYARGLRLVREKNDLTKAFDSISLELKASKSTSNIFAEKALLSAKHIEVPILRDKEGGICTFPLLDCSLQRRFLKIGAETPALVSESIKEYIINSSKKIADKIELEGLATFEYLVSEDEVYFLEVNSRLTVEHSITEMVTGFDLVREQINISFGKSLEIKKDIQARGHSIICRIYSEYPDSYKPFSGVLNDMFLPMGRNVRYEITAHVGWRVPIFYDHMIMKMSVWAKTREELLVRTTNLLKDSYFSGLITNISLLRQIFNNKKIINGTYGTEFLRDEFSFKKLEPSDDYKKAISVASAIKIYNKEKKHTGESLICKPKSPWVNSLGIERL